MKFWIRILLIGTLLLVLLLAAVWFFRIPIITSGLRWAGVNDPEISALDFNYPNTLTVKKVSGETGEGAFLMEKGKATITGWDVLGKDLHLTVESAQIILSEILAAASEPAPELSSKPQRPFNLANLPKFSLTLQDVSVRPRQSNAPWVTVSGSLSGGSSREATLVGETIAGTVNLKGRIEDESAELEVEWESGENPDWATTLSSLRDYGVEFPLESGPLWTGLEASASAEWQGTEGTWTLLARSNTISYRQNDLSVAAESLRTELNGDFRPNESSIRGTWQTGNFTYQQNENHLRINRLAGSLDLSPTLNSAQISLSDGRAMVSEIEIDEIAATIEVSQENGSSLAAILTGEAEAFEGRIDAELQARMAPMSYIEADIELAHVSLLAINKRFQFFDGVIDALVEGQLRFSWDKGVLTILPTTLEMVPGTKGTLRFEKKGWMTGNPDLDVTALAERLRIDKLLTRDDGAGILVELAARNLTVTKLSISLFEEELGDREGQIHLEGFSYVKETKIPVVLDIPIRGQLQETIRVLTGAALNI